MCLLANICILFRVWVIPRMDQCETGDDSGYLSAVGGRFARVRITSILFPSSLHCLNDPLSKIRGVIKPPPRATDSSSVYNSCTFKWKFSRLETWFGCKRFLFQVTAVRLHVFLVLVSRKLGSQNLHIHGHCWCSCKISFSPVFTTPMGIFGQKYPAMPHL